ncbi:hypothetical protein P3T23_009482 [Paraburkholderia sp. GAS448]
MNQHETTCITFSPGSRVIDERAYAEHVMPSRSQKQHNFWNIVSHSSEFAKKVDVSRKVADEYLEADRRAGRFQPRHNPLVPRKR